MRALVTASYVGEIGWELMSWQARVRRVFARGHFDRLVVLGGEGKSAFYADMPLDYRTVDLSILPGTACEDRRLLTDSNEVVPANVIRGMVEPQVNAVVQELCDDHWEVETLWPAYANVLWPCDQRYQSFIRFERSVREPLPAPWVVLARRGRSVGSANWTTQQWDEFSDLLHDQGINTSVYPCDSQAAIEALCGCDLAVGQSTGGLHLASLCGCPHVVWSREDSFLCTAWQMSNRQRYETFWNPLGTPVIYHGSPQLPQPAEAARWIVQALPRIGRRTGTAGRRAGFRWRWSWRSSLGRLIVPTRSSRRCPWRIERFIRANLL